MVSTPPFKPSMEFNLLIGSVPFAVGVHEEGQPVNLATFLHGAKLHGLPGQRLFTVKQVQIFERFVLLT